MNELDALANVDFATREVRQEKRRLTILRIGTCGVVQPDIPLGAYIFSEVSAGFDGLLNWYAGRDSVVLKDAESAFMEHAGWNRCLPVPYFVRAGESLTERFKDYAVMGMTVSAPGFYGPQCREVRLPIVIPDLLEKIRTFGYDGLRFNNIEMEGSAIAGLSRLFGHEGATICLGIAHRYVENADADYKSLMEPFVEMCLDRMAE